MMKIPLVLAAVAMLVLGIGSPAVGTVLYTFSGADGLAGTFTLDDTTPQLGHTTPEMLFTVYARFIPNRTRRDGSALLARMTAEASGTGEIRAAKEVGRS
jgi:hypothetical protein